MKSKICDYWEFEKLFLHKPERGDKVYQDYDGNLWELIKDEYPIKIVHLIPLNKNIYEEKTK